MTGAPCATFTFTPSGGSPAVAVNLSSIGNVSPAAEEIDVTALDSTDGCREFIAGYRDSGRLECSGFLKSGNASHAAVIAALGGAAGLCVIDFNGAKEGGTAARITFYGFIKSYHIGASQVNGAVGFRFTVRITGAIDYTAAAEA